MANPTEVEFTPAVLECTVAEDEVSLDKRTSYLIYHNGIDTAGAASTGNVYLSFSAAVDADESEGADKAILLSGQAPIPVGPGVETLKFKTGAGSPTINVVPSGKA